MSSEKRSSADEADASRKKMKKDEKYNPYLAHMYDDDADDANGNGEPSPNSPFAGVKRRATTAEQHTKIEDLDSNPFTGQAHSQKYFQILEKRRDLPVHKQRFVTDPAHMQNPPRHR
jgi:pre-mRNA-splicing factor ATP-dependent RNA helicase DHX15/PRP43